jgi:IclR family acetate operon transcriptional repressor
MPKTDADNLLSRYARILEAVAASPAGLTLGAIGTAAGLQAATAHRLVNSLCDVGFLARPPGQKVYSLGSRMVQLCLVAVTPTSVVSLARPLLRELVKAHGETAYLTKLSGVTVESVAMEMPLPGEKSFVQPGRAMPFHASASAKAIFAFQPQDVIDRLLAEPRTRFTQDTKMSDAEILADLARVRNERFAVCDNELDPGVLSFATPVELDRWGVLFAVGVVGLSDRLGSRPRQEIKESLLHASKSLATQSQRTVDITPPPR